MRIAFFSTMGGLPWGGSEELWSRAARVMLDRGHDVAFNCLRWDPPAAQLQRLIDAGAQPTFRSRLRLGRTLRRSLEKLRVLRLKYFRWLRTARPDFVVVSFSYHADDPQIANTCRQLGIRYAIVLQAAGPHHWIAPRSLADFRSAYAGAERCFFVSEQNRDTVQVNLGIDLSHSEIIDNPFNVALDAAPAWPAANETWNLACVARIHFPSKSQDLIAQVLRLPKWKGRPLTVTLWGSDEGFLPQLQRLIELYGIQNQLRYGGFADDISELWASHHGLLLPSRMEGNALSLIEAMMCGRMVITTAVGRAAELIDDNQSGFLAPAATVGLLDNALERAWQRRHDWQLLGQHAAAVIRKRHSLRPAEDFADRILDVAKRAKVAQRMAA
jgi:glycosyltransferase involved in cell wall biosynthesis